jgi:NAD-dependent SIR2 family protein deacetylase
MTHPTLTHTQQAEIKTLWDKAEGVVILAGAGMSVDSGLPDFRGSTGLWTTAKETFITKATAKSFEVNPLEAWNFYVNRILQYQHAQPHAGYTQLLELLKQHNKPYFVVTSNIDGHFLKAGYDPDLLYEIHGNLRYTQCTQPCCRNLVPMPKFRTTLSCDAEIPQCPYCKRHARPNVMMFSDPGVVWTQMDEGQERWRNWAAPKLQVLGIEIGAGTGIPSIRIFGEERTTALLRINLYESEVSRQWDLGLSATGLDGIRCVVQAVDGP